MTWAYVASFSSKIISTRRPGFFKAESLEAPSTTAVSPGASVTPSSTVMLPPDAPSTAQVSYVFHLEKIYIMYMDGSFAKGHVLISILIRKKQY